jgi:hypothetical protein
MKDMQFQIIEGIVENLETKNINFKFLADANKNSNVASIVALLQAATGSPGAVNSAQAATDPGDPVEGFTMNIGSTKVYGNFWKTSFKNGDEVTVIGSMRGKTFIAVAVVNRFEKIIWMEPHCERGTAAKALHLFKCSIAFVVAVFLFAAFGFRNDNAPLWFLFSATAVSSFLVLGATVGMSWKDFMRFSRQMNRVGAALKLENPENIDLFKSTRKQRKLGKPELPMGVYYY